MMATLMTMATMRDLASALQDSRPPPGFNETPEAPLQAVFRGDSDPYRDGIGAAHLGTCVRSRLARPEGQAAPEPAACQLERRAQATKPVHGFCDLRGCGLREVVAVAVENAGCEAPQLQQHSAMLSASMPAESWLPAPLLSPTMVTSASATRPPTPEWGPMNR